MRRRKARLPPSALKPPPHSVMKPPPVSTPKPPPLGTPPNPRRPRAVISSDGGYLKDLFALFPELPWPARRPARVRPRRNPRVALRRR